ncbi:putative eIF-2 alpha-like protein [Largemouth bass virus]|uniref:EIF-2 alpha-like protein n=1 Tax=Largemouth bass virus TaxID=176656 RepID=A0A9E7TLN6_9VIRU|nr:putative eIF-2 alpha-like protein [Mandarin fish ranavirus]UUY86213.1 putative eIF-2 alpha-like protein [Largemouth bass virus]WEI29051.1 putative eIF-2 alpha-like protein [Largemouth bass virus]WHA35514.1 putative eIF-2 alpha-like protein [Micropterus salmoides ranavirus]WHA35619.1 putative eIF-2 alpha-like protein [Siniperca chuatsi ranavirus]
MEGCRFYRESLPEKGQVTMCRVLPERHWWQEGFFVMMLEYGGAEGFVPAELLNRWGRCRDHRRYMEPGVDYCLLVHLVDKEKGYVDLAKFGVSKFDKMQCKQRYAAAKREHVALCNLASRLGMTTQQQFYDFMARGVWSLREKGIKTTDIKQEHLEGMALSPIERMGLLDSKLRLQSCHPVTVSVGVEATNMREVIWAVQEGYDSAHLSKGVGCQDSTFTVSLQSDDKCQITVTGKDSDCAYKTLYTALDCLKARCAANGVMCIVGAIPV